MNIDYETTIRNSNTIFSTMVCPACGSHITFRPNGKNVTIICDNLDCTSILLDDRKTLSLTQICGLLNNNGLNHLVQPQNKNNG